LLVVTATLCLCKCGGWCVSRRACRHDSTVRRQRFNHDLADSPSITYQNLPTTSTEVNSTSYSRCLIGVKNVTYWEGSGSWAQSVAEWPSGRKIAEFALLTEPTARQGDLTLSRHSQVPPCRLPVTVTVNSWRKLPAIFWTLFRQGSTSQS
jgi:hypothetical protein